MPSPFPGMDPYLEGHLWPDVHQRLAAQIARLLAPQLRPRYVARLATRFVADLSEIGPVRILYPDVDVTVARPAHEPVTTYEPSVTLAPPLFSPPLVLTQPDPPRIKLVTVEIRDTQGERLVTSIEILSPINKRGDGLAEYQQKRWLVMDSPAHLLEIDLLRRGHRLVSFERVEEKDRPLVEQASYFAFLTRSGSGRKVETWPLKMRDPLPMLPVPLLAPDPDVGLDLGAALRAIYDEAAYDLSIDYRQPPDPPFNDDDTKWADALLREPGLR
jgi:hypothetical protein